jgi:NTE family protein
MTLRIFRCEFAQACPGREHRSCNNQRSERAMKRTNPEYRAMWAILVVLILSPSPPLTAAPDSIGAQRPRIGLVLGGGGARGAAHVGVIKVLEEMCIPVDFIAGTSMGSVVGGLYASGMSTEELEREVASTDWGDLFRDSPERVDRSFRRKRDDDLYTFKAKPGFNNGDVQLPLAYIRGQKFDLLLNRLTLPIIEIDDFDQLPIPFRAVASDLETGKEVVLARGSMAKAIRASLAVPGAFDPVEIDDRLLVDGGLANNVPVSVARQMGAEVLIVVDVGAGLYRRDQLTNAVAVAVQLTGFLFTLNGELQIKTMGPRDALIRPELGDLSGADFHRAREAIRMGELAARKARETLQRYSIGPDEYARYREHRLRPKRELPRIDFVRIDNRSSVADEVIAGRITTPAGEPFDHAQLERDIGTIYGLDIFESVRYDVVREADQTGLLISTKAKRWGPNYLQFGLSASNDFDGDSTLRLGGIHSRTAVNALNGEWRTGVQLGDEPGIFTELHQPLEPGLRYFAYGRVGYDTQNVNIFDAAGNNVSRYQLAGYRLEVATGREFGTWGEGRLGYRWGDGRAKVLTGTPAPNIEIDRGEFFVQLSDDELDNPYFPRTGHYGVLEWRTGRRVLGSSASYEQILLDYVQPFTWGAHTLVGALSASTTVDDDAPLEALFPLGGFLRLSGLAQDQLRGQQAALASIVYLRRLSETRFFKSYVGMSAELGNVWQRPDAVSLDSANAAGSIFLGFDTPMSPIYLAYGQDEHGNLSFYAYLGPRFTF